MSFAEESKENMSVFPATSGQKRLYFLSMLEGGEAPYHLPGVIRFHGDTNDKKLEDAFRVLINRHDCLRTGFKAEAGEVNQIIFPEVTFQLEKYSCPEAEIDEKLISFVKPFVLSKPPLIHATLLEAIDSNVSCLLIDIHHIVADGISWTILLKDLEYILNSKHVDPIPFSFAESSTQLNGKSLRTEYTEHKKFWLDYFSDIPAPLDLPTDFKRGNTQNFDGDIVEFKISGQKLQDLKKSASKAGVSMHVFLMSAYTALLKSVSGQDEFVISFPHSGRFDERFSDVAGMFAGTGLLSVNPVSNKSFSQYANELMRETFKVFDHLEYPFEEIVDGLDLERDLSRNPLTDISFVYETSYDRNLNLAGKETEFFPLNKHTSSFDLTLDISDSGSELACTFEYKTSLFSKNTIEGWRKKFEWIIEQVIENPEILLGQLNLLNDTEKNQILNEWNKTDARLEFKTVPSEIKKIVSSCGDKIAVRLFEKTIRFDELGEAIECVSSNLINQYSVQKNDIVAVVLNRSVHIPSILIGIWNAGATYLPIDPNTPSDRISDIIVRSGSGFVITDQDSILEQQSQNYKTIEIDNLFVESVSETTKSTRLPSPDSLAYIIYTSGTTGTPKGVKITHRNLANYLCWARNEYLSESCPGDFPLYTSLSFDLTVTSLFLPLIAGQCLHIKESTPYPQEALAEIFNVDSGIHAVKMTPSHVLLLNDSSVQTETGIKLVILGGEEVLPKHLKILSRFHPLPRIVNEYGPTETTVGVIAKDISIHDPSILIGKPIANTQVYLLNELLRPVPVRSEGELFIGGKSVASGYHKDPETSSSRFIQNPFNGGDVLYRTGDLARWTVAGELEYLGRNDQQIKIRGYRVDPFEIQNEILNLDHINNAVVVDYTDTNDKLKLAAYMTGDLELEVDSIRESLVSRLPAYMVPEFFIQIDKIPLTINGKVNRKALPDPSAKLHQNSGDVVAPEDRIQKTIVDIWKEVLNRSPVSITDNYFNIGGDSIQSIQIISKMNASGYSVTVRDIFEAPTPVELAKRVKLIKCERVIDPSPVTGVVPLSPIQKNFFSQNRFYRQHYTQAVLIQSSEKVSFTALYKTLRLIHEQHDILRARYRVNDGIVEQSFADNHFFIQLDRVDSDTSYSREVLEGNAEEMASSMDLKSGSLLKTRLIHNGEADYILMVAHHLIIDAVSWSILISDMNNIYQQIISGKKPELPSRTHSYRDYVLSRQEWLKTNELKERSIFWQKIIDGTGVLIENVVQDTDLNTYGKTSLFAIEYDKDETDKVVESALSTETTVQDILLAAMEVHQENYSSGNSWSIDLEHFGRTALSQDLDLSRTIGWFTNIYPIKLERRHSTRTISRLKDINNYIKTSTVISNEFLLLKENGELSPDIKSPDFIFNYLGDISSGNDKSLFALNDLITRGSIGKTYPRSHSFEMEGWLDKGKLKLHLVFPESSDRSKVKVWWEGFLKALKSLVEDVQKEISEISKNSQQVENFISDNFEAGSIETFYKLTPVQEGMYFHQLKDPESLVYHEVFRFDYSGPIEIEKVQESWNRVRKIHPILRTSFHSSKTPYPVQLVHSYKEVAVEFVDFSSMSDQSQEKEIEALVNREYTRPFDLKSRELQRFVLIKRDHKNWTQIWAYPHILLDGWSTAIVLEDWFKTYFQLSEKRVHKQGARNGYSDYVDWYLKQSHGDTVRFWDNYLNENTSSLLADSVTEEPSSTFGEKLIEKLDEEQSNLLRFLATKHKTSSSQIVHLLWALALGKQLGKTDVIFGSVKSVRPDEIDNLENTAGLFLATLPVRMKWTEDKMFGELLVEMRDHFLEREAYLKTSLTEMGADNTFDHILTVENYPIDKDLFETRNESGEKIKLTSVTTFEATHFPLTIEVYLNDAIEFHFLYQPGRISESRLKDMISNIRMMIEVIEDSAEIKISTLMENLRTENEMLEEQDFISTISDIDEDF